MKKTVLLAATLMAAFCSGAQVFNPPVGIATSLGGGAYNLTPSASCGVYHAGAIWCTTPLSFNTSFILTYQSSSDIFSGSGADGICAVFGSNLTPLSLNGTAGYLGYYDNGGTNPDFKKSFAVEFDIFNDNPIVNDPAGLGDHTMVARDANPYTVLPGASPIQTSPTLSNIKDKRFHTYTITWNCSANTLRVYFDDSLRITSVYDYRTIFTNPNVVNWGLTAGIGSSCSNQIVKNINLIVTDSCSSACFLGAQFSAVPTGGCGITFTVGPVPGPYVTPAVYDWNFGDGSPEDIVTSNSVFHSYPGSGTYVTTLRLVGYNSQTGSCCDTIIYDTVTVNCPKGIMQPAKKEIPVPDGIKLFPNPSQGTLNVQTSQFNFNGIKIYNITGAKVWQQTYNNASNTSINISSLPNGMYVIELSDTNGNLHMQKINLIK